MRTPMIAFLAFLLTSPLAAQASQHPAQDEIPRIDAVFLLDTTGSMSALIQGAKEKIWSIAKEMVDADNTPEIRMGIIGYRDRGDAYVTRVFDLTTDIDKIYGELLKFQAAGGGDRPESVNQALDDAITGLNWDKDTATYRVMFLVGDSPPKMTYRDDVKYHVSAEQARQQDIIINTLLAGGAQDTGAIWREIARLTGGAYAEIPQSGNMQSIKTPYDQDIQALNIKLNQTSLLYGAAPMQEANKSKLDRSEAAGASTLADRQAYLKARKKEAEIVSGRGELINDLDDGVVSLDALADDELPEELKGKSREEQEALIAEKASERAELKQVLNELLEERDAYIEKELASRSEEELDSFDLEVRSMVREQGGAKGIAY